MRPDPVTLPVSALIALAEPLTEVDEFLRSGPCVVDDLADFLARRGHQHAGYDAHVVVDELSLAAAKLRRLTARLDAAAHTHLVSYVGEKRRRND